MRVAVLGSGNGALAVAYDWASHGHEVRLVSLPDYSRNATAVAAAGGITSTGVLEGTAPIAYAGTDMATGVRDAELAFVVGPAYATPPLAIAAAPHLRPGTAVVVCPSSCLGSVAFKHAAGLGLDDHSIVVAETSTLPYAVRATGDQQINVFHRLDAGVFAAALPRSETAQVVAALQQVYPRLAGAHSVFQTTLQNGNPVIHPAVTLLNAALIERTGGAFAFYEEGVTPGVGRLMAGVDAERLAIGRALGAEVLSEPALGVLQGYMLEDNYTTGYSTAPGFLGIGAQGTLDHRYLTEDVGFSMLFFVELADRVGVPTPVMDAVIEITSVVLGQDLRAQPGRTLASLGLADLTAEQLRQL